MSMRCFLAIRLSQSLKNELGSFQEKLRNKGIKGFRWVNPELLHITLKFLGDLTPGQISLLEKPLQELAGKTASFYLSLKGLGAFPHKKRPRVLWYGIKDGAAEVIHLSMGIENITKQIKLPLQQKPKEITPHLTIGRQKNTAPFPFEIFEQEWECKNRLYVDRFFLVKSTLYPSGPQYTPLKDFPLK
jgi:2'-5' RNA ligase